MTCPVCLYPNLPYPPRDYHICPCCGTEFGNDDAEYSHDRLREMWIAGGANWFFGRAPDYWNPWIQLVEGGRIGEIPQFKIEYIHPYESTRRMAWNPEQQFLITAHG